MAIDWSKHWTHWDVRRAAKRVANRLQNSLATRWNTYYDHPVGYALDDISVDFWGPSGRGDPITPSVGEKICARLLGNIDDRPIAWLIWNGRIWTPQNGWQPYNGWSGMHKDHVHVTFNMYSRVGGRWP